MEDLKDRVAKWVESPEGQAELKKTADAMRKMQQEAEQQRRDDIEWLAEYCRKPMTI